MSVEFSMSFIKTIFSNEFVFIIYYGYNIEIRAYKINKYSNSIGLFIVKLMFTRIDNQYILNPVDIDEIDDYLANHDYPLFVFQDVLKDLKRENIINDNRLTSKFLLELL
jgi:hypothetical protein